MILVFSKGASRHGPHLQNISLFRFGVGKLIGPDRPQLRIQPQTIHSQRRLENGWAKSSFVTSDGESPVENKIQALVEEIDADHLRNPFTV